MSEEQNNSSAATPASNQNLIIGIVMGAVILLLLLLVLSQRFGGGVGQSSSNELTSLQQEHEAARNTLEAERTRVGLTANSATNIAALASNIKSDTDTLASLVTSLQSEVVRLTENNKNIPGLLTQISSLQEQLNAARGAQAQLTGLQNQNKLLQDQLDRANAMIRDLQNQLAQAPGASDMDNLRRQLALAKQQREEYLRQINDLKAEAAGLVDATQLDALRERVAQLRSENERLRRELQDLRAKLDKELFVSKENLHPRAQRLFRELVKLEGRDKAGLEAAYNRIKNDLNAEVLNAVRFETGKANLNLTQENSIKNAIHSGAGNSFFLVVGYASKSGDASSNQDLSARRSTRVASVVNYLKRNGQNVQAVYLGETGRFGPADAPNQICELWEIRP